VAVNARDLFTRFANAVNSRDRAMLESMFHPEFTAMAPQSGERSKGFDGFWAQVESYPGGVPEMPALPEARLLGDDDRWAITPAYTVVPLATPNQFTILAAAAYPDGQRWHTISMVELREELIYRMEFFYAPELPAPLSDSIAAYGRG
jgi:hypothetical protein